MDHRAQIKLAQDFAERERGGIDIRFVESAEGVEICAFYKGAGGQAMTASQMVPWSAIDFESEQPLQRAVEQILDGMRRDIQRWK